eukprot:jgi/Picsp_1/5435/NSC_02794-R1_---NA---
MAMVPYRSNLNSSQFYGRSLADPYIPVEHVDLLKSMKTGGGTLGKSWLGGNDGAAQLTRTGASSVCKGKRSKNDFEVFMMQEKKEIVACSPTLLEGYDYKVFRATARELWDKLEDGKKRLCREKAAVLRERENASRPTHGTISSFCRGSRDSDKRSRAGLNLPKSVKSVAVKNIETKRPAGMRRSRAGRESKMMTNA